MPPDRQNNLIWTIPVRPPIPQVVPNGGTVRPRERHVIALRDQPEPVCLMTTAIPARSSPEIGPAPGRWHASKPRWAMGTTWTWGRRRSGDGYPAQVVFADPFAEVPGCAADTIGP